MQFNTKTTEQKQQTESKYLTPGVHEVKITAVEAGKSSVKGTPFLKFTFEDKTGKTTDDVLYFTEKTKDRNDITLGDITGAVSPLVTEISGATLEEYAKNYFKTNGKKFFRHRFTGKEIEGGMSENGEKKKNWFKAKMGYRFASESTNVDPSRLKPLSTDKNSTSYKFDWEHLPVTTDVATKVVATDSLPF